MPTVLTFGGPGRIGAALLTFTTTALTTVQLGAGLLLGGAASLLAAIVAVLVVRRMRHRVSVLPGVTVPLGSAV